MPNVVSLTRPRISGQSPINENCQNSRTTNDIDMKLRPVTENDKRNTITSKKDDDVMPANYDIIIAFPIYGQLEQSKIWVPDAWLEKLSFSLIVAFYFTKTERRSAKSLTQNLMLLLWVKVINILYLKNITHCPFYWGVSMPEYVVFNQLCCVSI